MGVGLPGNNPASRDPKHGVSSPNKLQVSEPNADGQKRRYLSPGAEARHRSKLAMRKREHGRRPGDGSASRAHSERRKIKSLRHRTGVRLSAVARARESSKGRSAVAAGEDGDSSDVSDTEVAALRSIVRQHGSGWRELEGIEPDDLLAEEIENIKVRAMQERGEMPPDEDSRLKPREIGSLMIRGASLKLPPEVHRMMLDIFQITILEPDYYPPMNQVGGSVHESYELLTGLVYAIGEFENTGP